MFGFGQKANWEEIPRSDRQYADQYEQSESGSRRGSSTRSIRNSIMYGRYAGLVASSDGYNGRNTKSPTTSAKAEHVSSLLGALSPAMPSGPSTSLQSSNSRSHTPSLMVPSPHFQAPRSHTPSLTVPDAPPRGLRSSQSPNLTAPSPSPRCHSVADFRLESPPATPGSVRTAYSQPNGNYSRSLAPGSSFGAAFATPRGRPCTPTAEEEEEGHAQEITWTPKQAQYSAVSLLSPPPSVSSNRTPESFRVMGRGGSGSAYREGNSVAAQSVSYRSRTSSTTSRDSLSKSSLLTLRGLLPWGRRKSGESLNHPPSSPPPPPPSLPPHLPEVQEHHRISPHWEVDNLTPKSHSGVMRRQSSISRLPSGATFVAPRTEAGAVERAVSPRVHKSMGDLRVALIPNHPLQVAPVKHHGRASKTPRGCERAKASLQEEEECSDSDSSDDAAVKTPRGSPQSPRAPRSAGAARTPPNHYTPLTPPPSAVPTKDAFESCSPASFDEESDSSGPADSAATQFARRVTSRRAPVPRDYDPRAHIPIKISETPFASYPCSPATRRTVGGISSAVPVPREEEEEEVGAVGSHASRRGKSDSVSRRHLETEPAKAWSGQWNGQMEEVISALRRL